MAPEDPSCRSSSHSKDSASTTPTEETILTPMENSSNKSQAEAPKARPSRRAVASKAAHKPKISATTLVFTAESESDSNNATDGSSEAESPEASDSDTDDEAEKTKKKSKSKKSKSKSKSRKRSTKKPKKKKKKSAPASSDSESNSSDTSDSDEEESDVDLALAKPILTFVQSKLLSLQNDVMQIYQQLALQQQQMPQMGAMGPPLGTQAFGAVAGPQNPYASNPYATYAPNNYPNPSLQAPSFAVPPPTTSFGLSNPPSIKDPVLLARARPGASAPTRNVPKSLPAELLGRVESELVKKPKSRAHPEFKRVDQVWDSKIHNFRLQDTTEASQNSKYDKYVFHVRRTFDWEGKYRATFVDIKSKLLRECLEDVVRNVKGVSLVDETPKLDPNLLFLYLEDFRRHLNNLKDLHPAGTRRKEIKKNKIRLDTKIQQLKLLIKYIDTDYAEIKQALYPMLDSGIITFELLWALWKPKTLAYTSTYGCATEPRIFKVDMAQVHSSVLTGQFHYVEGKYFEFDGKKFGYGAISEEIPEFQGARKITSLPCYPLKYHKDEARLRSELIERGKKFVSLCGVHYKSYQGMAFLKRKKNQVIKFNVSQSRVMVDPNIFRRINPNYHISPVKPKDHDIISDDGYSDASEDELSPSSASDTSFKKRRKFATKVFLDGNGAVRKVKVPKELLQQESQQDGLDSLPAKDPNPEQSVVANTDDAEGQAKGQDPGAKTAKAAEAAEAAEATEDIPGDHSDEKGEGDVQNDFSEEEYLLASPVVLGFAFSEKQWLEFTVSGIKDIKWNEKAWDSLVLEEGTKDLVKALVVSRKYHAANTIDDVIQGKGKGLVTVLHGPPGTGKTLTAEGISELLKCPLYMASAGELGTDSRFLEAELQKILDICHTWGAILLLDEADVFLEKRNMHDIHRNALVSIFLRQLEYFQGILFLTTNRVESFDEAFQSRIHIALRYDNLDVRAKRTIFKMFLDRVKDLGKLEVKALSDDDLNRLSKHDLNGREIKNVVGSAQDLAVHKKEPLSMRHILQVLEVHAKFGRDLKGGTGYEDAMRSYF